MQDRDLVRLDTSNPPGNEEQVAGYMRDRLAPLGFEADVIQTPTPGKAHLVARLRRPASAAILEDMHGIDERVSITGLNKGTDMVERILRAVATG